MEIVHKRMNRVDVLGLTGRLDAASAPLLRGQLDTLFAEGRNRIVLDMSGVDYLASAGLRVLVEARKRSRDPQLANLAGGDIRMTGLSPRLVEVFKLTGLYSMFEIYPDTLHAVGSF